MGEKVTWGDLVETQIWNGMSTGEWFRKYCHFDCIEMKGNLWGFMKYLLRDNRSGEEDCSGSCVLYENGKLVFEFLKENEKVRIGKWYGERKKIDADFSGFLFEFLGEGEGDAEICLNMFNSAQRPVLIAALGWLVNRQVVSMGYSVFCMVLHVNQVSEDRIRVPHVHCLAYRKSEEEVNG